MADTGLPRFIAPQLATLVRRPPKSGDWVYEVKHDGYRMLARLTANGARLFTRSGKDWTGRLPHLARALKKLALRGAWLDGEIVVPRPDGRASFQALQNAFEHGRDAQIVYYVFDAPFLGGRDLRPLPMRERKRRLKQALRRAPSAIRFSDDLTGTAREVLEHACRLGLEGLIGKEAGAPYVAGRTKSWIKLKCRQREDFVIAGYTAPAGSRRGFGALVLGFHERPGRLVYAGKVGTGFDEELLGSLSRRFAKLKRPDSPLENPPRAKGITWLAPQLVAEVAFAERTDDGVIRQGAFMGLREDIVARTSVRITHPERFIWPALGIRKIDLVRYFEQVGERLLPHLAGRPLSVVRCPDGAQKKCFYQRHLAGFKQVPSVKGRYFYVEAADEVIRLAQNGAVELHTWGAMVPDVRHPDRITMDLDPDPDLPWRKIMEGAQLTRGLIEGLGLRCFLKTTGGKGLHVVFPIERSHTWDEAKAFAAAIASFLARAEPRRFTATMAKARRKGLIFVDYLRNARTASAVAAYSPRARAGARVSTPLAWDELDRTDIRGAFTVQTIPERLRGADPWADYAKTKQAITPAMRKALGVS